jgi:hypothetical protein
MPLTQTESYNPVTRRYFQQIYLAVTGGGE